MRYEFSAPLWVHDAGAAWHFVTLPEDHADEIDEVTASTQRGFGSVRVVATVGGTTWHTSIFPDTKRASFVLPVKKPVRVAEGLKAGDIVAVCLRLADV